MKLQDNEIRIYKVLSEQHGDETANQLIKNSRAISGWVKMIELRTTKQVVWLINRQILGRDKYNV